MLIKDSITPRGRIEEQPRSAFSVLTGALDRLLGGGDDEQSWADSDEVYERRTGQKSTVHHERSQVILVCRYQRCGRSFETTNRQRRYCSDRCMKKAYEARHPERGKNA